MDKIVHFEIPAVNLKRAKKFYVNAFGWQMNDVPEMNYVIVRTTESGKNGMPRKPGSINGGMMKRSKIVNAPVVTIDVYNIDASMKKLKKLGGKVVIGKQSIGKMGYIAYFKDTEGNILGLWQTKK